MSGEKALYPQPNPHWEGGSHRLLVALLKHKTENWQLSMAKKGKSGREIRKGTQTETETVAAFAAAASGKDIWQCAWYSRTKCAIYIQISALKKRETKQIKKGGSHKAYARCCCSCFKAKRTSGWTKYIFFYLNEPTHTYTYIIYLCVCVCDM